MTLAVLANDDLGFGVGEVLDALLRLEVELDPMALVFRVNEAEGVTAEAVHVPVGRRNAAVAHDDRDLVQGFWQRRPEIPVVLGAAHIGARIAFDRVVEIGELERVAQEKHRRVVAHKIPVAFFRIKLHGKPPDIAFGIGRTTLTGYGSKPGKQFSLLPNP